MHSRLSRIFNSMKQRCYNSNYKHYKDYGGRGITVCEEWNNREYIGFPRITKGWKAFEKWAIENGYEENLTIDRIDNNKGYSPENCRWTSYKVQANNTRSNHYITYNGETKTLTEWCETLHLSYSRTKTRLNKYNWSVEKAFEIKDNVCLKMITYEGKTQSLADWCRELDLKYDKIKDRLNKCHWTVEQAFEKN